MMGEDILESAQNLRTLLLNDGESESVDAGFTEGERAPIAVVVFDVSARPLGCTTKIEKSY